MPYALHPGPVLYALCLMPCALCSTPRPCALCSTPRPRALCPVLYALHPGPVLYALCSTPRPCAICSMPYTQALCSMPCALCSMPYTQALCSMLYALHTGPVLYALHPGPMLYALCPMLCPYDQTKQHVYCGFPTSSHSKRFTIVPSIHPFMLTFTHRRWCQQCRAAASSSGAVTVMCLAQGHLDTQLGGAGDRTNNLLVTSQKVAPETHATHIYTPLVKL